MGVSLHFSESVCVHTCVYVLGEDVEGLLVLLGVCYFQGCFLLGNFRISVASGRGRDVYEPCVLCYHSWKELRSAGADGSGCWSPSSGLVTGKHSEFSPAVSTFVR